MSDIKLDIRIPDLETLSAAANLSITNDKPIMMDYWQDSIDKQAFIGVKANNEKSLVKDEEQYTSTILKIFKKKTEYILVTENSIYIVANDISVRRISSTDH